MGAAQAQEVFQSQVPSLVLNQFKNNHPRATEEEWEVKGDVYKVEFETGWNIDHEEWYQANGELIKHSEEITKKELPELVVNTILSDFSGRTIHDLQRVTQGKDTVYQMELTALFRDDWEVVIQSDGKTLHKVVD